MVVAVRAQARLAPLPCDPAPSPLVGPGHASWWIGVLFAIGSVCFLLGPFPGFAGLVGSAADGAVFFVGSVFFTSAALLQYLRPPTRTVIRPAAGPAGSG